MLIGSYEKNIVFFNFHLLKNIIALTINKRFLMYRF